MTGCGGYRSPLHGITVRVHNPDYEYAPTSGPFVSGGESSASCGAGRRTAASICKPGKINGHAYVGIALRNGNFC
jgi:hypothetical protein